MEAYRDGVNVDRLISLAALIAFAKIRESNTARPVRIENELDNTLQNSGNLYKLNSSAFRNISKNKGYTKGNNKRSPFKRIR